MPSHKERVVIEYFGDDNYHVYWQNAEKEILGVCGQDIVDEIEDWMDGEKNRELKR